MTPMRTSLAFSSIPGELVQLFLVFCSFYRINDTECEKKVDLTSGNFIQIQKTIDRNSDKALSRDKVRYNHQPNRTQ